MESELRLLFLVKLALTLNSYNLFIGLLRQIKFNVFSVTDITLVDLISNILFSGLICQIILSKAAQILRSQSATLPKLV